MKIPKVIAETGCNHKGDIQIAREMIGVAAHLLIRCRKVSKAFEQGIAYS